MGLYDSNEQQYRAYEQAVVWPGNTMEVPVDFVPVPEAVGASTSQTIVTGVVIGVVLLCAVVLLIWQIRKHQEALKDFIISFFKHELMLVIDGVFELVDIIGDIYSCQVSGILLAFAFAHSHGTARHVCSRARARTHARTHACTHAVHVAFQAGVWLRRTFLSVYGVPVPGRARLTLLGF